MEKILFPLNLILYFIVSEEMAEFIPSSLPDELLFSRLIRGLTLSGVPVEDYLELLFGKHKLSVHPFLPSGLDLISNHCHEPPQILLNQQTLAPLFMHFLPKYQDKIQTSLVDLSPSLALRYCQLVCFREKQKLTIKFCSVCARDDLFNFGVSYWHLSHQIPGVESCSKHRIRLSHLELPTTSKLEHGFLPPVINEDFPSTQLSYELACFSKFYLGGVGSKVPFHIDDLRTNLKNLGYITAEGYTFRKRLLADLYGFTKELAIDKSSLLPDSKTDYRYISYLLSGKVSQHPFKYLLLKFWIHKQPLSQMPVSPNLEVTAPMPLEDNECVKLIKDGNSLATVSKLTGRSRCFLKALALRLGLKVALKPRLLTDNVIRAVKRLASRGFHRKEIAKRLGLSSGSVEQVISTSPELVAWRKKCKYESKRRKYKAQLLRYIEGHPDAIRQEIKRECNAAFFWLYVNERFWLESALPNPLLPKTTSRIDWSVRDEILAQKVAKLMPMHSNALSRTQLDKLLGCHGWLTKKKNKLPLTMSTYYSLFLAHQRK